MNENTNKSTVLIIVAIIGASATCVASIIGLGQPIVEKMADIYLSTPAPILSSTLTVQVGTTSNDTSVILSTPTQSDVLPTATTRLDIPTYTPLPTHTPIPPQPTATPIPPQPTAIPTPSEPTIAPITTDNLVTNSGFEEPIQGSWEWGGQISMEAGQNSNTAICSTQNDINDGFLWIGVAQEIPITSGQTYLYTAWLKWENAIQAHLQMWWYDSLGQKISESFPAGPYDGNSGGWVQKGAKIVAPTNATRVRIMAWHGVLNNSIKVPGSKICVDNVIFELVQ